MSNIVTHITDQDFPIFATGDQTISGEKVFTTRPSVSGNLFLISGDPIEATLIRKHSDVFEAHANDIEGFFIAKTFNYSDGCIGIEFYHPDGTRLGYSILGNRYGDGFVQSLSNTFRIEKIFGDLAYLQSAGLKDEFGRIFNLPTKEGTLALFSDVTGNIPLNIVFTTGNQIISGTKRFVDDVYIKNLYVTGTETIVNTTNFNVQSPYLLLNLTGGAVDGGIFFVTGSGLTGINDYGPIIGFDHSKNFKFGIARRSDDLSSLNDIASIQNINNYSGFVTNNFYTRNNPSGFITSKDVVYTTGDQTISNIKTFYNYRTIFGQGNIGQVIIADDNYGGELGITTENNEVIGIKIDGSFQYGGGFPNVKPPISVLNGNVSLYNTGGNSVHDNPFLTIDNGINKIKFGIQPQDPEALQQPLDDAGIIFDGNGGNQYILEFLNGAAGNAGGKITFNKTGYVAYQQDLSNFVNGNLSVGIYNYKASINYDSQYSRQESTINAREQTSPVSGIKNDDIVNLYFSDPTAELTAPIDNGVKNTIYSRTLKVNPGVLVDHNGAASSRNLIKFDDTTQYSGKAIRKVRYNSTIGNGYERILLSAASYDVGNCPIIRPKTRRIETFYDINVPSGGGTRYFLFRTPTSFPFAQATCMNLRFSFEADSSPCVISGLVYGTNEHVLTISGANYSFVQKERVILISKGEGGNTAEFKHW